MSVIIDHGLCNGCMSCIYVCPHRVLELNDKSKAEVARPDICIECAHCMSVCKRKAISADFKYARLGKSTQKLDLPTAKQVEDFLVSRRSTRAYSDKEVKKEDIEKILQLAAYSPRTHNDRNIKFMVIGPDKADRLESMASSYYKGLKDDLIGRITRDAGFKILLGAPVTIALYGKKAEGGEFNLTMWDSLIAAHTMLLAAHGMGLGACYNGLLLLAYNEKPLIGEFIGLPEDQKVYMFVELGYPKSSVKYYNVIERSEHDVIWK